MIFRGRLITLARTTLACVAAVAAVSGCQQRGWPGLRSSNPLERSETIVKIAESRDTEAIPALIDRLEDDDRAVRMYAAIALRELVGEDFGYRFYDQPADRAAAVARWRDALREGRLRPVAPSSAGGNNFGGDADTGQAAREPIRASAQPPTDRAEAGVNP